MSDKYILRDGEPVACDDLMEWARWFERAREERIVKKDTIGEARVSTVFLGLDHNWGEGPPLLYETMIFGGPHDEYQERCSTRAEALAMHERAVQLAGQPHQPEDSQ